MAGAVCIPAFAGQAPASPFDTLLEQVRSEREQGSVADRTREQIFLERRDDRNNL